MRRGHTASSISHPALFNSRIAKVFPDHQPVDCERPPHAKEKHRFLINVTFAPDPLSPLLKARIGEGFMFKGFRDFVLRGNVVDLAVGVVIGAAFGTVVTALVKDLLTPIIAAIVRKPDFPAFFSNSMGPSSCTAISSMPPSPSC
jgi:Large-conductance mechanosensitive channel, MscL